MVTLGKALSATSVIVIPGFTPARAAGRAPLPHIRTLVKSRTEVVFRTVFIAFLRGALGRLVNWVVPMYCTLAHMRPADRLCFIVVRG